ncbi:MAG: hypothetical protein H7843_12600 [Nitrospirota bacterium]
MVFTLKSFGKIRSLSLWILACTTMIAVFVCPSQSYAEWADWILNANLSAQYRDNINYTFASDERRGDFITIPSASIGRYYQLGERTRLRLTVDVSGEIYSLYHKLDSVLAGGSFALVQKLGVGHEIPWVSLTGSASYLDVSDSSRDSMIYTVGVNAGGYVSERVDLQAGYQYTARRGKDLSAADPGTSGRVFDLNSHRISLTANFLVAPCLVITPGYFFNTGDFVSSSGKKYVDTIKGYAKATAHDGDYGQPLWAYKLNGFAHQFSIGASYALTGHMSLNAGYSHVVGRANGWDYYENIVKFALMYSY